MKFKLLMPWIMLAALHFVAAGIARALPIITGKESTPPILPLPRHYQSFSAAFNLASGVTLDLNDLSPDAKDRLSWHWEQFKKEDPQSGGGATPSIQVRLLGKNEIVDKEISRSAGKWMNEIGEEGYVLVLRKNRSLIAAKTEAGLFYGLQSLKQLIRAKWNHELSVTDWPMLPHRVIYDDISRGPISTVAYIKKQIERMAELKINGLSFYIEHIVRPVSHPDFAPIDGKLTIEQIKELSAYAKRFHMQLIGSFQSFGHFEKILALPQYSSLGATNTLISPTDPRSKKFLENVIGELCDAFDSPYFNVNCDETFDLGQGNTKADVQKIGPAAYYANHLRFLYDIVRRHGKKMMMWGDFAVEHEEVIDLLPKDIIYLTWEYGDQHSYDHWIKPFADRGLSYMVCPGILNSYRMFPDMAMAKANIAGFIDAGQRKGAIGAITTIWDDGGTYLFSGDWYGVYVAAEKSWTTDSAAGISFDERYERAAYNTYNGNYVKALFKLMQLRSLPLTYNLNDRLWQQKILPDSGRRLIFNNTGARSALHILGEASQLARACKPQRNEADINTLQFSIEQYRLMIDTRIKLASIAKAYQSAFSGNAAADERRAMLNKSIKSVHELIEGYAGLKTRFSKAWLAENQTYWLDTVLAAYDKKINSLAQLERDLNDAPGYSRLATPHSIHLSIEESNNFYFQNWMITGPFPVADNDKFPSFLYADNAEYNRPPSPGDFTQYLGKMYRWKKFASADGGDINLEDLYTQKDPAFIYAYCSLTSSNDTTVNAFIGENILHEVYCNGVKAGELNNNTVSLPLKKGINYILVKLRKNGGQDESFSFHLGNQLNITNSKHKYQLNAKKESYDAE